ncbi:MAG: DNA polymerase [Proteobacteria bacterium]|nr:DNA polymerase [Pseudomonadota bacterium]
MAGVPDTVGVAITTESEHGAGAVDDPHRARIASISVDDGDAEIIFDMRVLPVNAIYQLWTRRIVMHDPRLAIQFLAKLGVYPRQVESTMQLIGLERGVGARDEVAPFKAWRDLSATRERAAGAYARQRDACIVAAHAELRGVGFDREQHRQFVRNLNSGIMAARKAFHGVTGEIAPETPEAARRFLERTLCTSDLDGWPRTSSGLLSVARGDLARAAHLPCIRHLDYITRSKHLLACFGHRLRDDVNPVTGRLHPRINIAGAKSGRATVSNPPLQQMPREDTAPGFRRCFAADPGNVLVGGDYSQMELRAAAAMSGDEAMTQAFANGEDLHCTTAAFVAGIAPADVTPNQRQGAKVINFSAVYGAGPQGLAETAWTNYRTVMSEAAAATALQALARSYPGLARHLQACHDRCKASGVLEIFDGRVVRAEWEGGEISYPQSCNLPIQGACADVTMLAMIKLDAATTDHGLGRLLVLPVHDELILEVPEQFADLAGDLLSTAMVEAFTEIFPTAPTLNLVEVKKARTWADLK